MANRKLKEHKIKLVFELNNNESIQFLKKIIIMIMKLQIKIFLMKL